MREGVSIRRRQAEATPTGHAAGLAQTEDNLGVLLSELGPHEEALTVTAEAVSQWRQLAETDARAFQPPPREAEQLTSRM
jgi:hypothetical protein